MHDEKRLAPPSTARRPGEHRQRYRKKQCLFPALDADSPQIGRRFPLDPSVFHV